MRYTRSHVISKIFLNVIQYTLKHKQIIFLLSFYFIVNLTNLTLLPIFGDESIYLDWGWMHTHIPERLYDAQLDAKQPLLIWLFGISERFFSDPLFAGRLVSVIAGAITTVGIYAIGKKLLNRRTAMMASLFYCLDPIFFFYNRQALMDASIGCIGIWSFYALLNLIRTPSIRNAIILGVIFGTGFFIKSSALLFIISCSAIILYFIIKKAKTELLKLYFIAVGSFFIFDILVFINPVFWQKLSSNNRYSFTLMELINLPLKQWIDHLLGFFEIGFIYLTPIIFMSGVIGLILLWKKI